MKPQRGNDCVRVIQQLETWQHENLGMLMARWFTERCCRGESCKSHRWSTGPSKESRQPGRKVATCHAMVETAWQILAYPLVSYPKSCVFRNPDSAPVRGTPTLQLRNQTAYMTSLGVKRKQGQLQNWQVQRPLSPCLPSSGLMHKKKQNKTKKPE